MHWQKKVGSTKELCVMLQEIYELFMKETMKETDERNN